MKLQIRLGGLALLLFFIVAGCATDGYRTVQSGVVKVGKLRVTLDEGWRRAPGEQTPERHSAIRVYTREGLEFDRLYLVGGIADGQTIFREEAASSQPRFDASMSANELADLIAQSLQAATWGGTSTVIARNFEERGFTGVPGIRFHVEITVPGRLGQRGIGGAFVDDGRLYAVLFIAEAPDHFDRHKESANRIINSAILSVKTIGRA